MSRWAYVKPERMSLKRHPEFSELWVQDLIAEDPSILGLGELILLQKERIQPRAGRLDLLLQDPETKRRYQIEIQLGATDEAHIIRTIEYWDIERKRYPQYEHCAVLIAEDITSRFLNVVGLFNGTIPLIAIQMQALKFDDRMSLIFTKVMDELSRGVVDEDEEALAAPADRGYWERKASKDTVQIADKLIEIVRQLDPALEPKYNKFYIGLRKNNEPCNFLTFRPRKNSVTFTIKLPRTDEFDSMIETAGLETLAFGNSGSYRLSLRKTDIPDKLEILKKLIKEANSFNN